MPPAVVHNLSARSIAELRGVDHRLVDVVLLASTLCKVPFLVVDGHRTIAEQREYVRRGASRTLKSNHLTGRAVDLCGMVNGKLNWNLSPHIRDAMFAAAKQLGVRIAWGGNWRSFQDTPHFELLG